MSGTDKGGRRCSSPGVTSLPAELGLSQMPQVLSLLVAGKQDDVCSAHGRLCGTMSSSYPSNVARAPEVVAATRRTIADIFGNALMGGRGEGSLLASEHFKSILSSFLSSLDSPVAVLDPAGKIIAVNERWMKFPHTGGDPRKLEVGTNYLEAIRDLIPKSDDFL